MQRAWKAPDPPDVAAWWQGVDAEEEKAAKGNSQHKKKSPVAAPGGWNNWGHLFTKTSSTTKGILTQCSSIFELLLWKKGMTD